MIKRLNGSYLVNEKNKYFYYDTEDRMLFCQFPSWTLEMKIFPPIADMQQKYFPTLTKKGLVQLSRLSVEENFHSLNKWNILETAKNLMMKKLRHQKLLQSLSDGMSRLLKEEIASPQHGWSFTPISNNDFKKVGKDSIIIIGGFAEPVHALVKSVEDSTVVAAVYSSNPNFRKGQTISIHKDNLVLKI